MVDDGIYAWGWNEHGNLGLGGRKDCEVPMKVKVAAELSNNNAKVSFDLTFRRMINSFIFIFPTKLRL